MTETSRGAISVGKKKAQGTTIFGEDNRQEGYEGGGGGEGRGRQLSMDRAKASEIRETEAERSVSPLKLSAM